MEYGGEIRKEAERAEENANPAGRRRDMHISFKILTGFALGALASGLGAALPLIGQLTMICVFVTLVMGLLAYAWGDIPGWAAYAAALEAGAYLLGGTLLCGLELLAFILPGACVIAQDRRGAPFFKRLYSALGLQLCGFVLALGLIALIYRENLGDLAGRLLLNGYKSLGADARNTLLQYYTRLYSSLGIRVPEGTADEVFEQIIALLTEYIKLGAAGSLIVFAVLNALPGVLLCSYIRNRRGIPDAAYEPVMKWRMPPQAVLTVIVFTFIGFIMNAAFGQAGTAVLIAILAADSCACSVQYIASVTDRLSHFPSGRGYKVFIFIIVTMFMFNITWLYGLMSMLVGSHGLITGFMRRRRGDGGF
ncbi:MAG: DUF2232 domain-containing protein [Clostridia bacterium]|nr:DUF2232 domain-containing protein [Clostridia bacterium]